jgi:tRNA threonylcarbamoyladenosine biosynthesis protein TsaB
MRILGIDTSTKFLSIAIYDRGKIYSYNLEVGRKLSSLITATIKKVLDAAGVDIKTIDYFACGLGPGSFTGMRVGLATVKGLSWSLKKPVVGISTLDILSRNANLADGQVIVMLDARRGLVYSAIYRKKNNDFKKLTPDMLLTPAELFKKVKLSSVILGDAVGLYRDKVLSQLKNTIIMDGDFWYPQPHNIVRLALEKIRSGRKQLSNAFNVEPIYLYPKECQIRTSHTANRRAKP